MKAVARKQPKIRIDTPVLVYSGVSLLILGPLLLPGYILTLDMVFTPQLRLPSELTSGYLLSALLHVLDLALPSDGIQKLLLMIILSLTGVGAFRLAQQLGVEGRAPLYVAGLVYMINPFTYGRFIAGQYTVLFGYALLPWFMRALLRLTLRPDWRLALIACGWLVAISIVSIHAILPALIIAGLIVGGRLVRFRSDRTRSLGLIRYSLAVAGMFLVASSYWLLPIALGSGAQAQFIDSFTQSDHSAFATGGGSVVGRISNVVHLQGFWAERYGLFILPQDAVPFPLWALCLVVLLGLVVLGAWWLWRLGRWGSLALLGALLVIGVWLAAGVGNSWLSDNLPLFAGYREPHKLAMLIALSQAICVAFGVAAVLRYFENRKQETLAGMMTILALALPFLVTPTYLWAAKGQLRAVQYPAGWQAINQQLNADTEARQNLFLPWHAYMYTNFAGRLIANPAPKFFDKPMIVSHNPEFAGAAAYKPTPAARQIELALHDAKQGSLRLSTVLTALDVRYVVLAKDSDYEQYAHLKQQPGLKLVADYPEISLYYNQKHKGNR